MRRRLLVGVVCLFSILLVIIFTIPLFVNWTDFQKKFERQATSILGKQIVVKGGIKIRILPFPSIIFSDIMIAPKEDGSFESKVENISIHADFLPLFRGEIRVFMYIDQPYLKIDLSQNQSKIPLDWSVPFTKDNSSNKMRIIHNIALGNVLVHGGVVKIINQTSDQSYFLSDLDFKIFSHDLNLSSSLSLDSIKGAVIAEGIGSFNNKKTSFRFTANFPSKNNSISLKTQIFPFFSPMVIDLSGNISWDNKAPVYEGVISAFGDFSKLTNLNIPLKKSHLVGNFSFSFNEIRMSHYKFYSNPSDFSKKEEDEERKNLDNDNKKTKKTT
ncbi:AsmA family protein [Candidatus Liberibacter africanus]|uniref:AsmA family protein n=1 Tax=Liberibacter africanus TaxID=34020 RepID=UPI00069B9241|nr:AsmA family protein [Candidatus Liberibacter africanus]QTP64285.1 AsmA family protein [Candidatus Liberibacter africanus]